MQKNRYRTVLPKEETRVKLQQCSNDYINANFVSGPTGCMSKFICTQAPLKETCSDFWQMVWEQNTFVVVMLTQVEERGEEKSFQYWPLRVGETKGFGNFEVRLEGEERRGNFEHRLVELKHEGRVRRVYQLQYVGWPDHGVPNNSVQICELIKVTLDLERLTNFCGPVVVHCSAGIGRTGTFVALYQFFETLQDPSHWGVFEIVLNLRRQRDAMVQTAEQYLFIYRTINQVLSVSARISSDLLSSFASTSSTNLIPVLLNRKEATGFPSYFDSFGSSERSVMIRA